MDKGKIKVGIETLIENLVAFHSLLKEAGEDQYGMVDNTAQCSYHANKIEIQMGNSSFYAYCVYCPWQSAKFGSRTESDAAGKDHAMTCTQHPKYRYDQLRSALGTLAADCGAFMVLPEDPDSKLIGFIRHWIASEREMRFEKSTEQCTKIGELSKEVDRQTDAKNDAINDANYVKDMIYKAAGVDSNQMHWTTALKALVSNSKVRDTVHLDLEIIRLKNVVEQKDKEIKDLREITIRDRDTLARKNNEIVDLENTLVEKSKRVRDLDRLVGTRIHKLEIALRNVKRRIEGWATETTVQLIDEALLGEG